MCSSHTVYLNSLNGISVSSASNTACGTCEIFQMLILDTEKGWRSYFQDAMFKCM